MSTWALARLYHRVYINDELVRIAGPVTQQEAIGQLITTCSFQMVSRPTGEPTEGDDVRVEWVDPFNSVYYRQFVGTVDVCDVDSQPHRYVIIATDQFQLARRVRDGADLTLSGGGATDKDAWEAMADHFGLDYDTADIADAGLELGERVPVKWLADNSTTAGQMILALDDVTGMTSRILPDGRAVRFPFENVPDGGTGSTRTYTKGTDLTLFKNKRTHGGRDAIQTRWAVRGVSYDTDGGSCSSTPWATAVSGNAFIGRRTKVGRGEFQSDLIQDEAHAEAMVRRLIAATNKLPDTFTAEMLNDPTIFPGLKIAIVDDTYGINTGGLQHFTIQSIDRNGSSMTLTLIAGPPGSAGTVTTGVEKICSDVHSNLDWPGDFEMPAFDPPTLATGETLILDGEVPTDDGGTDDGGSGSERYFGPVEGTDLIPGLWWRDDSEPGVITGLGTGTVDHQMPAPDAIGIATFVGAGGLHEEFAIASIIHLSGHFFPDTFPDLGDVQIGVTDDTGGQATALDFAFDPPGVWIGTSLYNFNSEDFDPDATIDPFDDGGLDFDITWNPALGTCIAILNPDGANVTLTVPYDPSAYDFVKLTLFGHYAGASGFALIEFSELRIEVS